MSVISSACIMETRKPILLVKLNKINSIGLIAILMFECYVICVIPVVVQSGYSKINRIYSCLPSVELQLMKLHYSGRNLHLYLTILSELTFDNFLCYGYIKGSFIEKKMFNHTTLLELF